MYATKNVNNSVTNISTLCDSSRAPSFPFDPLPFDPLPVLELPLPLDPLELLAHPPIFTHFGTVLPSLYDVSASRKKDDDDDASSMVRKYSLYHIAIYAIILPRGELREGGSIYNLRCLYCKYKLEMNLKMH